MAQENYDENEMEDAAIEQRASRVRRQLSRGRFAQITEKLTGGPERPGEQKITRSPVVGNDQQLDVVKYLARRLISQ